MHAKITAEKGTEVLRGMGQEIPELYRKNVKKVAERAEVSEESAKMMILITAALMDLYPDDERIVDLLMKDIGLKGN